MLRREECKSDKKTEKKPSDLKRLFGYAGNFRFLTVASIILPAVSAVMALAPFLKDSPIILMDEATASLDVENETMIQESPPKLMKLIKNKTVLIIAHRMRIVSGADKIVVLKDGVVAESGRPEELINENGVYARMMTLQTRSNAWKL